VVNKEDRQDIGQIDDGGEDEMQGHPSRNEPQDANTEKELPCGIGRVVAAELQDHELDGPCRRGDGEDVDRLVEPYPPRGGLLHDKSGGHQEQGNEHAIDKEGPEVFRSSEVI